MADYKVTDTELISIADEIRSRGGTSASLSWPNGFISAIASISGGGSTSSIYAFLKVYALPNTPIIVRKDSSTISPLLVDTLNNIYYYVLPEQGTYTVGGYVQRTISATTYFETYIIHDGYVSNIIAVSSNSGDSYLVNGRDGRRILSDGNYLVFAFAKSDNGYMCGCFYTLTDYGAYSNVISSNAGYIDKGTVTITNPEDGTESETVYVYGSTRGGFNGNPSASMTFADNVEWSGNLNSITFFGPYGSAKAVYEACSLEDKILFWNLLQMTKTV